MGLFYGHNKINGIVFLTNKNGTFNPTIGTINSDVATWNIAGEAAQTTNTPSFTLDGSTKIVRLTLSDYSNIEIFDISEQNILGILDISLLTHAYEIKYDVNVGITGVINPVNDAVITNYLSSNTGIVSLDLSAFSKLAGIISGLNNSSLVTLTTGSSSEIITNFIFHTSAIAGVVDLSGYTMLGNDLRLYNNPITNIILPSSSRDFTLIYLSDTDIGVINWAALTGTVDQIQVNNCGFTSAESDETLVLIDDNLDVAVSVEIAGNNGALTDGSVTGFDGLAAKNSLIAKGVTVDFN